MEFTPTLQSLRQHTVPNWYHDAKFGIFIHWGLYSVPGFAYSERGALKSITKRLVEQGGFGNFLRNNLVSEWYQNTLRLGPNLTEQYHNEHFGAGFPYEDFVPRFNEGAREWDPEEWARLFAAAGARYVTLVTKHHDGFLLWPSETPNPLKPGYHADRDIVGDLSRAVRGHGMRLGLYYSSALDWTFTASPVASITDVLTSGPESPEYSEYVKRHWTELIDRYAPSILWSDIGYPPRGDLLDLFAYFYNRVPDGVVNDRWMQYPVALTRALRFPPLKAILNRVGERQLVKDAANFLPTPPHCDFRTPEYSQFAETTAYKWETDRGVGNSFGFNRADPEENHLTSDDAVRLLVDIVSKNGNLLLNIGPRADGSIPEVQERCLRGLGNWLRRNGEAIYGTRPWVRPSAITADGIEVRFTQTEGALNMILLGKPASRHVHILDLHSARELAAVLVGSGERLLAEPVDDGLQIEWPEDVESAAAYVIRLSPKPEA